MSKLKRLGILLIIIGVFIPLVAYPFTTLITKGMIRLAPTRPRYLEVVIVNIAIPYSYIMAFSITLAFIGIGIVALYQEKKH